MSLFASSSSQSKFTFEYDIFLTLTDPKDRVRSYLENRLRDAGIKVFTYRMIEELPIQKTIESCGLVMVVFTQEFVESDMCLKRLVNIMWCHKTMNKSVLTVFYGVSQEEVREQLQDLDLRKSAAWDLDFDLDSRKAIAEAASLSGVILGQLEDFNRRSSVALESDPLLDFDGFTQDWRSAASESDDDLNSPYLSDQDVNTLIAKVVSQVGLQPRVDKVLHRLGWESHGNEKTIIAGIWGVAGIGKTTMARTIYDRIGCHFNCTSFLANISDVWDNNNGQVLLQKQLLSDIQVNRMEQGPYRRALIVLDDVNQVGQLTQLCGNTEQYGEGSLILITTRNKDLLDHFVDTSYEMEKLGDGESLQLFGWHAFKNFDPITNDFVNLSGKIITLCKGIPLILEVIGSLLYNKTESEWQEVLDKLESVPSDQIEHILRISLDYLEDSEKELFSAIARLYVGQDKSNFIHLLDASSMGRGMQVLMERRLVKFVNDKIHVHDLLRKIGRLTTTANDDDDERKFTYSYDVFLSFRGEDTRKSFVTHLYNALKQAGIKVFIDEEGLARGEQIPSSLLQAIQNSRISIIIFSKNYAGSSWCLQELEKIMECYKINGQEVFPIFYDVQPSEVRKQKNAFGKAWEKLVTTFSISRGKKLAINLKKALTEVANLSGWDMQNYRTEAELLDDVVKTMTTRLDNSKYMFVAHHPVGLESRMHDIIELLSRDSNGIIIIGIWGMGGIGKTTMAKAIYNEMGQSFVGKSFIANIREVWKQDNGQVYLQEQLLSSILLGKRRINLQNAELGKSIIKASLCQKRVFLVLDDVNNEDQLKTLCGSREWFGQGSRIVITTRDERLLHILQVDKVFNVREMDDNESIELFSWHAFKQALPERNFIELSRMIVSYSRGLPLALEILGSYLFDRETPYWESVLNRLKRIPYGKIYEILKISYDGLSDQIEQEIFLDICCFFIGKERSYATQVLDGCGLDAEIAITHLIERSLVKVIKFGNKNILDMHDLLRDMGREIIREHSPEEPEKHTRLWLKDDVLNVLGNNIGTIATKGLSLTMPRNDGSISLSTKAFKEMKRLRLLKLDHVQLDGNYGYLSKELRWLCWHRFQSENLPTDFNLEKIVAVDLKWSNLTKVWEKSQVLEQLKILNLSYSHRLIETPDFSKLPNLEKLILKHCLCLSIVHPSIGNLKHLIILNLKNCNGLEHLPRSLYDLKSLRTLNLFGCSKIKRLDEDIEKMESLTVLVASQTAITQVPNSIVRLKNIKYVSLCGYEGLPQDVFPSIFSSWMPLTNNPKSLFQASGVMPWLIKGLSHPLFAKSHESFKAIPTTSQASCNKAPALIGSHEQVHKEMSETFMSSITIHVGELNKVIDTLLSSISQGCSERGSGVNSLPGDNYPHWRNFKGEGSSIFFEIPQMIGKSLKGLVLCIIYLSSQDNIMGSKYPVGVLVSNRTKATIKFFQKDETSRASKDEDNWQDIISNLEPGNKVEVMVTFASDLRVKNTLVYLVYDEDVSKRIMY